MALGQTPIETAHWGHGLRDLSKYLPDICWILLISVNWSSILFPDSWCSDVGSYSEDLRLQPNKILGSISQSPWLGKLIPEVTRSWFNWAVFFEPCLLDQSRDYLLAFKNSLGFFNPRTGNPKVPSLGFFMEIHWSNLPGDYLCSWCPYNCAPVSFLSC